MEKKCEKYSRIYYETSKNYPKKQVTVLGIFITILLKLSGNRCLEWCFLTFYHLHPFPVLNLSFILSSYMLTPASGIFPLLISIYTIALPWQFLLDSKIVFSPRGGPSESCILHHDFLCQFSQSHWSLLLVINCVLHPLSSTHT